jgi:hypothetical protein
MTQTEVLLTVACLGTVALVVLAAVCVRLAAFPPKDVRMTPAMRIELYAASVAMLAILGQTWIEHPGIPGDADRAPAKTSSQ